MRSQGCRGLKIKNQTYLDPARKRVKKRVFKCPCSGAYTPRAMESVAVGGKARRTSTKKTDCSVYINVNVDAHTSERLPRIDGCQHLWSSSTTLYSMFCRRGSRDYVKPLAQPFLDWCGHTSSRCPARVEPSPATEHTGLGTLRSCDHRHPTTGPAGAGCAFPDQRHQKEGTVADKVLICTSLLQLKCALTFACCRDNARSRIWFKMPSVPKWIPSMHTSSFSLWQSSQDHFWTIDWMLRAAWKRWSGPSQNRWKPCSCTVMCGSKTIHLRR
jgi:hypothetical protein